MAAIMHAIETAVHGRKGGASAPSLYDLAERITALMDAWDAAEADGERAGVEAELRAAVEAEVRKVDGIAKYLAHLESQQAFAAAEIKRLQERKARFASRQERLEDYVIAVMRAFDARKLDGAVSTLALRSCPVSVEVFEPEALPEDFRNVRPVYTPDKTAIRAALERGEMVAGAKLVTGKQTLVRR
jgi:chemotaxis protein histidine kinase CheA